MDRYSSKTAALAVLVGVVAAVVTACVYVGMYATTGQRIYDGIQRREIIYYAHRWQLELFKPASQLETILRRRNLVVIHLPPP